MKPKAIIIANGEQPPVDLLIAAINSGQYQVICADGGYHHAERLGIVPDVVLGDMDSISAEEISSLKGKVSVKQFSGQDDTDVEKAITFCKENGITEIALFGVTGKLIDHELSNIILLFRYAPELRVRIFNKDSVLEAVTGKFRRKVNRGARVSFFSFGSEIIVKTDGLKYLLPENKLIFGRQESNGNIAEKDIISFDVTGGYMLLILPSCIGDLV